MLCYTYYRYSSAGQTAGTIKDQRTACTRYAQGQGWKIVGEHQDIARSAWKHGREGRKGLDEMLSKIEGGHLSNGVVLVFDLDRLSRDFALGFSDILNLNRMGIAIADTSHGLYQQDSLEGILTTVLTLHRAQSESDVKSRRITSALQRKKDQGFWVGKPPLGYDAVKKGGGMVLVPNKYADAVRHIHDMVIDHQPRSAMIAYLRSISPRKKWTYASIRFVICNRTYAGYLPGDGPLIEGNHPPLISKSTYHKAVEANVRPARTLKQRKLTSLHKLVICELCGEYMVTAAGSTPGKSLYLRCRSALYWKKCKGRSVHRAQAEAVALAYINEGALTGILEDNDLPTPQYLEEKLASLVGCQVRLIEAIGEGKPAAALVAKIDELEIEIVNTTNELESLRNSAPPAPVEPLDKLPHDVSYYIKSMKTNSLRTVWSIDGIFGTAEVTV